MRWAAVENSTSSKEQASKSPSGGWRQWTSKAKADFAVLTEFCEVVGPRVCYIHKLSYHEFPESLDNEKWKLNFALKCMGVDYRRKKPQHALPASNSFDMQSFFTDYEHNLHVFVHHFAVPDFFGRGYTRAISLAYVSQTPKKVHRIVGALKAHFTRISTELKEAAQEVFLAKIDDALKWLNWKLEKYRQEPVTLDATPSKSGSSADEVTGLREILAANSKFYTHTGSQDYFAANKYEEYFQVSLDEKTLNDIKEDMIEIREQFSEPIREMQASECTNRLFKLRDRDRQHHRPHAKREEFVSLMKLLHKESVERLTNRLDKILSTFHRSSLDIMIDRTARLPDKDPQLLFNIGTLSVIPVGLNRTKLRTNRRSSGPSPFASERTPQRPEANLSLPSNSSHLTSANSSHLTSTNSSHLTSEEEPLADEGPTTPHSHQLASSNSWRQQTTLRTALREGEEIDEKEPPARTSSKRGSLPSEDLSWATIPTTSKHKSSSASGFWAPAQPPIASSTGNTTGNETKTSSGSSPHPQKLGTPTPVDTASGDKTSQGSEERYERKSQISDSIKIPCTPVSSSRRGQKNGLYRAPDHDLDHILSKLLLSKFRDFAEDLLFTILLNRPLVIVSHSEMKKKAQTYAWALAHLAPGHSQKSTPVWRTTPSTLDQLATIKIAAMSTEAWKKSLAYLTTEEGSKNDWVSWVDLTTGKFYGQSYRRKRSGGGSGHSPRRILHEVLKDRNFETPSQFRRHLCSKLLELQLATYLYFWMAVVGVAKAPWSHSSGQNHQHLDVPFLRPLDSSQKRDYLSRLKLTHPMDQTLVQQWARLIESTTYEHYLQKKLPPDPPALMETPKRTANVSSVRDRLLRNHRKPATLIFLQ